MRAAAIIERQFIQWRELADQLSAIGVLPDTQRHFTKSRIAVGVSGGADSMALAYLLHNLTHTQNHAVKAYDVHAFVVDHGLRTESRDEARLVKQNLSNLGIKSELLTIRWPHGIDPKTTSGFEEKARDARYELMATSALRYGCIGLFTGHHQDDNVETLLFRLARNRQRPLHSFCGIPAKGLIPCEHIFGVQGYAEGSHLEKERYGSRRKIELIERPFTGVSLYRPLLSFPKSRILATCSAYKIAYVDDRTNHDPMFATRNAIRYLRKLNLPQALQSRRLLALQDRASQYVNKVDKSAKSLLQNVYKLRLYSETATVELVTKLPPNAAQDVSWQYLMARTIEMVAPLSNNSFPAHLAAPKLHDISQAETCDIGSITRTVTSKAMIHTEQFDNRIRRFLVHRQPFDTRDIENKSLSFHLDKSTEESQIPGLASSQCLLWDGRFWIRISCADQDQVTRISIRPYLEQDLKHVKEVLLARKLYAKFKRRLSSVMPAQDSSGQNNPLPNFVRHTLPVLVYNDRVIAFPTVGFVVDGEAVRGLRWEVKYRRANRVLDFFADYFQKGERHVV